MFESLISNIRRKLSKTSDDIKYKADVKTVASQESGIKRSFQIFKSKRKNENVLNPITMNSYENCDNLALSPRAIGTAECAETEVEWTILADNCPNILDKFTRIVSITDNQQQRTKRNDREEIRKRLAMGVDTEEYYSIGHIPVERPTKKPSLQSRLQNGKNLQICYMNETASDNESQHSDSEKSSSNQSLLSSSIFSKSSYNHPYQTRPLSVNITKNDKLSLVQSVNWRPSSFPLKAAKSKSSHSLGHIQLRESDFYALQATLQTEARIALAQAKELARTQMERERRSRAVSPVSGMLRASMHKASVPLAPDRRRLSRQLLTDMNVAQLQVIVNSLHGQIESLNEALVSLLMARDELHMSQDAVLVDIEDLTRYFGVKQEQSKKNKGARTGVRRLASYVHK